MIPEEMPAYMIPARILSWIIFSLIVTGALRKILKDLGSGVKAEGVLSKFLSPDNIFALLIYPALLYVFAMVFRHSWTIWHQSEIFWPSQILFLLAILSWFTVRHYLILPLIFLGLAIALTWMTIRNYEKYLVDQNISASNTSTPTANPLTLLPEDTLASNQLMPDSLVVIADTRNHEPETKWDEIVTYEVPVGAWSEPIEIGPGTAWEASPSGHVQTIYGWASDFEIHNECPPGCQEHPENARVHIGDSRRYLVRRYQSLDGHPLQVVMKTKKLP